MNNIKKSIGWADYSFNPVTGCLNKCPYCYARKFAKRLQGMRHPKYTYGFAPTFHKDSLLEPIEEKYKDCKKIFVCSMADLFGDWVLEEWIKAIIEVTSLAPEYTFMFLTKNPKRYSDFVFPSNCMLGVTITNQTDASNLTADILKIKHDRVFLSIEPLLSDIQNLPDRPYELIIIGAETGNRKDKVITNPAWIDSINKWANEHKSYNMFLKGSLRNNEKNNGSLF